MNTELQARLDKASKAAEIVLHEILNEIDGQTIVIKNHAHFRRLLQEGNVKLETLALATNVTSGRLWVGMMRYIKKADTTGVYLTVEGDGTLSSFLPYDKASDWLFEGNVAKNIKFGYTYKLLEG